VNESLEILGLPPGQLQFSDGETPWEIYPEDFEHKRIIGRGGFSEVHKYLHRPTQKFLAIKFQKIVFDPDSREARDSNSRTYVYKMLLREIAALISANSPYIPYYYGLSFTRSTVAFCLEVLDFNAHFLYRRVYTKSTEMANRDGG
jgi:serine/threonine protein kinase